MNNRCSGRQNTKNEMERKYNALKSKLDALTTEKAERASKAVRLNSFITNLQNSEDMLLT